MEFSQPQEMIMTYTLSSWKNQGLNHPRWMRSKRMFDPKTYHPKTQAI